MTPPDARQVAEQIWKKAYSAWCVERSADDSSGALQAGDVAATDTIARALTDARREEAEAIKAIITDAHTETRHVFNDLSGTMSPWAAAGQAADYMRETLLAGFRQRAAAEEGEAP